LLADTLRWPVAEVPAEDLELESVVILRLGAVLCPADFERVIEQFFEWDAPLRRFSGSFFPWSFSVFRLARSVIASDRRPTFSRRRFPLISKYWM
jgi:hypothetical protein